MWEPLFRFPLNTDRMDGSRVWTCAPAPDIYNMIPCLCLNVPTWDPAVPRWHQCGAHQESPGLWPCGPWTFCQGAPNAVHTAMPLTFVLWTPTPPARVPQVRCTPGHSAHTHLASSQPAKTISMHHLSRGWSYPRLLLQDWERKLFWLIYRNKHRNQCRDIGICFK